VAIRRKSFAEVLACVLLTFVGAARGASTESNWSVHVWQSEDGLPSNKITGVVQTKDGYLWAATDEGLAQFDGVRFQTFSPPAFAGGTSSKIGTMVRSAGGGLLMSLQRGPVVRLEPGMPPAIFLNGLPQLLPVSVAEDSDGSVWATFHTAVYRIKSGETVQMSSKDGLPSDKLECTLVEDEKGRVWFAQGGYVGIVADGRFHVLAQLTTTGTRIATARSGGMWVCSGSELYHCYEDGNLEDRGGF